MHNLIYASSATYLFSDAELLEILTKSRLNNAKLDVTGLLLYHEGSILQILEGEKTVLASLYNKILYDPRHKGLIKMIDSEIPERNFKEWSMGFQSLSKEDWSQLDGYLNLKNLAQLRNMMASGSKALISMIKSFISVTNLQ